MDKEWVFIIFNALTIPLYVIIFGLIGGYLRYLNNSVHNRIIPSAFKDSSSMVMDKRGENTTDYQNESIPKNSNLISKEKRRNIFFKSLRDIALIFLAAIFAIASYFLLSGDNFIAIATIIFIVGLVTEDIIKILIKFMREGFSNHN